MKGESPLSRQSSLSRLPKIKTFANTCVIHGATCTDLHTETKFVSGATQTLSLRTARIHDAISSPVCDVLVRHPASYVLTRPAEVTGLARFAWNDLRKASASNGRRSAGGCSP